MKINPDRVVFVLCFIGMAAYLLIEFGALA
jgi:hypothetical protein